MHKLVKKHSLTPEEIEQRTAKYVGDIPDEEIDRIYEESVKDLAPDTMLQGKIVKIVGDDVVIDVGCKSEGVVQLREFSDPSAIDVGDKVEVLLEAVEDEAGIVVLSKFKADRIRGWEKLIETKKEGDVVKGRAVRKIKGGLLVDVGVPVFLPASQVDIRRTGDIGDYVGREVECKIIKIDEERRNIVVSRRRLIEEQRDKAKLELLAEIKVGDMRKGVVKNIADFGAFVDLGGIDGLLHITDMSWGRVTHPSEVVAIDDEIEVKIIGLDLDRERIALGLKQKSESPWKNINEKYPISSRIKGEVVNIMSYGAFVKLEEGVEGLVHISEMSWTKRVNHPSEIVSIGDIVEVIVLDINTDKQEISLGMKQTEVNPWLLVEEKYPPGTVIEGRVRNLTNYGAFIEIEEGIDGLLHISDMSWTKKVNHPSEIVKKSEKVRTVILSVDKDKKRVALGLKQLFEDPWDGDIPQRYKEGDVVTGDITKLASFGAFVQLEKDLEGLLHISEMSNTKISGAEDAVKIGQSVQLKVIKVDRDARKIGLSLKRLETAEAAAATATTESGGPKPLEITLEEGEGEPAAAKPAESIPESKTETPPVSETGAEISEPAAAESQQKPEAETPEVEAAPPKEEPQADMTRPSEPPAAEVPEEPKAETSEAPAAIAEVEPKAEDTEAVPPSVEEKPEAESAGAEAAADKPEAAGIVPPPEASGEEASEKQEQPPAG